FLRLLSSPPCSRLFPYTTLFRSDLLGGFTQTLDPLGGVLDLLTDHVHAGDGALYHLVALVGDGYRTFRYRGGLGGVGRYLVNGHEIGRASCRERVEISARGVAVKTNSRARQQ